MLWSMQAADVPRALEEFADPNKATAEARYFKVYDGGYGAGDRFLGLTVPTVRKVARQFRALSLGEIEKLLDSPLHEHRQAGLMIMAAQFVGSTRDQQKQLYDLYMHRTDAVNNWDLVDGSAPVIVGGYLMDKPRDVLYELARSGNIWERRIAILATLAFIRVRQFDDIYALAELLLHDQHDLIHKAVGWMLRETGKRDRVALVAFLDKHAHELPRTALRYAVEHFPSEQRQRYMTTR